MKLPMNMLSTDEQMQRLDNRLEQIEFEIKQLIANQQAAYIILQENLQRLDLMMEKLDLAPQAKIEIPNYRSVLVPQAILEQLKSDRPE
ncbi:hypothetical protein ACN4EG_16675 [Alkalinema pantanalense CENA528]|uniref:hypothetical protein n=1 Tax=Alkalinema pantanalense TaxID=1620705 RepID=UPI003D6F9E49